MLNRILFYSQGIQVCLNLLMHWLPIRVAGELHEVQILDPAVLHVAQEVSQTKCELILVYEYSG